MDSVIGHERNQSLHDVHPVTAPQRCSQTVNGATVQAPTSTDPIRPPMRGNPWASADPVPIQAVILAAGRGSRLASAIHNRPKCLSDVGGRALIYHQLSLLTETGIRHICVITGYRADEVREAVGARAELIHNKAWAETNSLYSLGLCRDWVSGALLVINCDVLFHAEVLYRLLACPGSAFAYDSSSGTEEEHTKVEIDEDASLTSMSKTLPTYRSQGENVGLLYFDKRAVRLLFREVGALLQGGGQQMWVTAAVQELASYIAMHAIDIADLPWVEIDFPHDLEHARQDIWPRICGRPCSFCYPQSPVDQSTELRHLLTGWTRVSKRSGITGTVPGEQPVCEPTDEVVEQLWHSLGGRLCHELINEIAAEVSAKFKDARITAFIPILVARMTRNRLVAEMRRNSTEV